ncbi:MAG: asparagine synthase (glutamine-hydrolyzing) [Flavobacteriaceae bacterium]|nr:asparagine synthase (glutamine-hydrolyzing) [Flavobacteriaceae bacterium]
MCGISGIIRFHGVEVIKSELKKIGMTMHHRGPDYFGIYIDGSFGFAHNRLSIIDLSEGANQPFTDEEHVLVFNGEIYNYAELRIELESQYQFKTQSDTEVLFAALKIWGIEKTIDQLMGMFAFAFHDKRSKETWLVRDRYGIKPLYYFSTSNELVFASEAKGIWAIRDIKTDRIKTVFSIYGSGDSDMNHTVFENVEQLKPGHYLHLSASGGIKSRCYFSMEDLAEESLYNEYSKMSRNEIHKKFHFLIKEATERMLISDAPVGCFVSGGVDSSLLTALAVKYKNIQLFNSDVKDYGSELKNAKGVADFIGGNLNTVEFKKEDYISQITKATWHFEAPIVSHVNALPMANVSQLAYNHNVKVVLSGEGSDELFLGYPGILFNKYRNMALLPSRAVQQLYRMIPGLSSILPGHEKHVLPLMNVDFFRQSRRTHYFEKVAYLKESEKEMSFQTVFMFRELLLSLLQRNDRMAMMWSIEARFPFLYEPLVKFAMNIPLNFKYRRTASFHNIKHPFIIDKAIVRDAAAKYLPKDLAYRQKWGFGTNAAIQLRTKARFFSNGYLADTFKMTDQGLDTMLQKTDTYSISKLVAIELFGRMYEYRQPLNELEQHCLENLSMV